MTSGRKPLVPFYVLGILTAFGPLSIDMYLPSLPTIQAFFLASPETVQLTLGLFLGSFALGQLLLGPVSDSLGRRPVLIGGILVFVAASGWCAVSGSLAELIAARTLQALGACTGGVVARAIVRDLFSADSAARQLSHLMMITTVAPLTAPTIGGWLLVWAGWRAIFGLLGAFGLLALVAVIFLAPETRPVEQKVPLRIGPHLRAFGALLAHPTVVGCVLGGGLCFAGVFAYIAGSPFVFIRLFGVPPQYFGLFFGLNVLGLLAGSTLTSWIVERVGWRPLLIVATALAALAGSALLVTGITGFGGLAGLVVPLFFYVAVLGAVFPLAGAGAMMPLPERAGAASALVGATRFALGAVSAAAVGLLDNGTAVPMVAIMAFGSFGALAAVLLLVRRG
ncbi:MAG: Bcr/CflA family multidrug efflux MFS transporter [bacterium]